MDCSPPGASVRGILQARILEWAAISFSRGSFQSKDWTQATLQADSLLSEPLGSPGHFCICIYIFRASQVTPANAEDSGDMGSIPGSGTSPIGGSGNPLQYSCLGNSHGQRSLVGYSPWGHTVRHDGATEHICMSAWPSQHNTLIQSYLGEFLAVQWLGFHSVTAEGPGWGTKISQAVWCALPLCQKTHQNDKPWG